jgi:hypothetical protein
MADTSISLSPDEVLSLSPDEVLSLPPDEVRRAVECVISDRAKELIAQGYPDREARRLAEEDVAAALPEAPDRVLFEEARVVGGEDSWPAVFALRKRVLLRGFRPPDEGRARAALEQARGVVAKALVDFERDPLIASLPEDARRKALEAATEGAWRIAVEQPLDAELVERYREVEARAAEREGVRVRRVLREVWNRRRVARLLRVRPPRRAPRPRRPRTRSRARPRAPTSADGDEGPHHAPAGAARLLLAAGGVR